MSASVSIMNQFAEGLSTAASQASRSPMLAGAETGGDLENITRVVSQGDAGDGIEASVKLLEGPVIGVLMLRAGKAGDELAAALRSVLQLDLPERLASSTHGRYCIRWMSPDEWLLSCPLEEAFEIETRLRDGVSGHIAVVNISGGYCVFNLTGRDAVNVLKKSTGYDVHAHNFSSGKVVNTTFAKTQVTLRAVDVEQYEIIIRRSFAHYLWLWLHRAGAEYNMEASVTIA